MSDPTITKNKIGKCDVTTRSNPMCDSNGIATVAKYNVTEKLGCEAKVFANQKRSLKCGIIDKAMDRLAGTTLFKKVSKLTCHLRMASHTIKKKGDKRYAQSTSDVINKCVLDKKIK